MIKLVLFNTLTLHLLTTKYVFRIIFDTSKLPFSFDLRLGLFYSVLPWFNNSIGKEIGERPHRIIDIICPVLFDLRLFIEQ